MGAQTGSFKTAFRAEMLKGRRGGARKVALVAPLPFCALGVLDRGIGSAGILAMGLGVLCFVPLVARDPWHAATRSAENPEALLRAAAKELGVVALNLFCYVGAALVALGALTALDRAPIAAGLVMIACIAALVLYRRHRKRHPRSYNLTKPLGIVLFMLAFGFAAGAFGTLQTSSALADALEGPRE